MSKNMAVLNNNRIVENIISCADDMEETSTLITYSDANPAYIGGDYVDGYFYSAQPYPSWTRDNGTWIAPIVYPKDGKYYVWDQENGSWVDYETL